MADSLEPGPDGLYSICVFNAEDVSEEEIQEIFGQFGEVSKVHRMKNIVFVRYPSAEEATNCVDSMRGHAKFRVSFGKKKKGSSTYGRSERDKDSGHFGEMARRPDGDGFDRRNNGFNSNTMGRGNWNADGRGDGQRSRAGSNTRAMPQLVPFPPPEPVVENAQPPETAKVVIFSNLHPKMGQNNIYELCNKVHTPPLHIAMKSFRRPPYPKMHYALVYVRDSSELDNLISSFNNLKLNGFKLIVGSADKYIEEGKEIRSKDNK